MSAGLSFVGLTQFLAGVGVKDAADLKPDVVDARENLRMGTKMGCQDPSDRREMVWKPDQQGRASPDIRGRRLLLEDRGIRGVSVFQAEEPGTKWKMPAVTEPDDVDQADGSRQDGDDARSADDAPPSEQAEEADTGKAGIRSIFRTSTGADDPIAASRRCFLESPRAAVLT